jgi:two-component system NarL family response regulator
MGCADHTAIAMEPPGPVRVLVADDHRLMREGTAALLTRDPAIEVVGLADGGEQALALAGELRPDVLVLDLWMPDLSGIEVCAEIRSRHEETQVLILTVSEQEPDLLAALRVGAAGYLLKDMPPSELVEAVLGAGAGEPRIPPSMASRVLSEVDGGGLGMIEDLSPREREVLELMAEGLRNREIAGRLFLSEATVKTHVRHVLDKLRLRNRAEAAAFAARVAGRRRAR